MTDKKILQLILDEQASIFEALKRLEKTIDDGFKNMSLSFDRLEQKINKLEKRFSPTRD